MCITQSWSVLFCQVSFEIVKCEFFSLIFFFKVFFSSLCWNPWISSEFSRWSGPRWASWVPSLWPRNSTTSSPGLWPIQSLHLWLLFLTASPGLGPIHWVHGLLSYPELVLLWMCPPSFFLSPHPFGHQGLNPVLVHCCFCPSGCKCPWAVEACHYRRLQSWSSCLWTILWRSGKVQHAAREPCTGTSCWKTAAAWPHWVRLCSLVT